MTETQMERYQKHMSLGFKRSQNAQFSASLLPSNFHSSFTVVKNGLIQKPSFDPNKLIRIFIISQLPNIKDMRYKRFYIIIHMITHPFQGDLVLIRNGEWTEEVSLQVSGITQCAVRQLYLSYNQRATMVKEIAHIHFAALTELVLGGNGIESVEGLARVRMAHIEEVSLWNNNITSVEVMRKAAWPSLKTLIIENNYFGDANSLVQGCFPR